MRRSVMIKGASHPPIRLTRTASIMASTETPLQKKTRSELIEEISDLEWEILYLERHLLSLYRSAFEKSFACSAFTANSASNTSSYDRKLPAKEAFNCTQNQVTYSVEASHANDETNLPQGNKMLSTSGHRTLAEHLGAPIQDHLPETPCKTSEDIIRCISSVYCKLTNSRNQQLEGLPSSSSSFTSSSTLSPEDPSHNCSPQCWYEAATSPCHQTKLSKHKNDPYKDMIQVPKLCMDGDRYDLASSMLKNFRSLIGRLEAVDPTKMDQQEQLAFWINIHNALTMHAFLAYGPHQNQTRNTSSIHRAAYNIGGRSINMHVIQNIILGCYHPHYHSSHFSPLFASAMKFRKVNCKHPYALDHAEPCAYFALCLGASSDPAVRIYTAKDVHQELKLAKREYIQANVSIQKGKIIIPKLLYCYARDASVELPNLIEMVSCSMQEDEQRAIQQCFQRKGSKCVKLSPCIRDFRYLLHRDLAT